MMFHICVYVFVIFLNQQKHTLNKLPICPIFSPWTSIWDHFVKKGMMSVYNQPSLKLKSALYHWRIWSDARSSNDSTSKHMHSRGYAHNLAQLAPVCASLQQINALSSWTCRKNKMTWTQHPVHICSNLFVVYFVSHFIVWWIVICWFDLMCAIFH